MERDDYEFPEEELYSESPLLISTIFANVKDSLEDLARGNPISEKDEKYLRQTGYLFGRINWDSKHYQDPDTTHLVCIATNLRPLYYRWQERNEKEITLDSFEAFYQTLVNGEMRMDEEQLGDFLDLLESISNDKLLEAQYGHSKDIGLSA
ncbi:hypothetical protein J4477_04635 [Candidatus Pacearchaeota archaeon]|nr:hypothetical protein [Candidatus Pacearchaeota archaeon]